MLGTVKTRQLYIKGLIAHQTIGPQADLQDRAPNAIHKREVWVKAEKSAVFFGIALRAYVSRVELCKAANPIVLQAT